MRDPSVDEEKNDDRQCDRRRDYCQPKSSGQDIAIDNGCRPDAKDGRRDAVDDDVDREDADGRDGEESLWPKKVQQDDPGEGSSDAKDAPNEYR